MNPSFSTKLISTKEASTLSGYHSDYLARLCREGKIEGQQIGRAWVVSQTSLEAFVKNQEARKVEMRESLSQQREEEYRKSQKTTTTEIPVAIPVTRVAARRSTVISSPFLSTPSTYTSLSFQKRGLALAGTFAVLVLAIAVTQNAAFRVAGTTSLALGTSVSDGLYTIAGSALARANTSESSTHTAPLFAQTNSFASSSLGAAVFAVSSTTGRSTAFAPSASATAPFVALATNLVVAPRAYASENSSTPFNSTSSNAFGMIATGVSSDTRYAFVSPTAPNLALASATALRTITDPIALTRAYVNAVQGMMGAYQNGVYAWASNTPEAAAIMTDGAVNAGATIASTVSSLTQQGTKIALTGVTQTPITTGIALGQTLRQKNALGVSPVVALRAPVQISSDTAHGVAVAVSHSDDTVLGVLGSTDLALTDAGMQTHQVLTQVASAAGAPLAPMAQNLSQAAAAALGARNYSVAEQIALGTYEALHGVVDGTTNTLALLFGSPFSSYSPFGSPAGGGLFAVVPTLSIPHPVGSSIAFAPAPYGEDGGSGTGSSRTIIQQFFNQSPTTQGASQSYVDSAISTLKGLMFEQIESAVFPANTSRGGGGGGGGATQVITDFAHIAITGGSISGTDFTGGSISNTNISSTTIASSTITNTSISATDLVVTGSTTLNGLTAGSSTFNGSVGINGDLNVTGNISGGSLSVGGLSSNNTIIAPNFIATNTNATSTFTNVALTNLFATLAQATTGSFGQLYATLATIGTLAADNAVIGNSTTTNATSTNFYATNGTITNLTTGNVATNNLNAANGTITNLAFTNATGTALNLAQLTTGSATVTGNANVGSLTIGNLNGFLKATAGAISTSLVNLTTDVTGILPVTNGGTGTSSFALNGVVYGNGTNGLLTTSQGAAGMVLVGTGGAPAFSDAITIGTSVTTPIVNGTTALQLNGQNINTGGVLSNVAYLDQANTFSQLQNFTGGISATTGSFGSATATSLSANTLYATSSTFQNTNTTNLVAASSTINTLTATSFTLGSSSFTSLLGAGLVNNAGNLTVTLAPFTTDNLAEGVTNQYFSQSRARGSLSATTPLAYNSTTGTFSIQQANAAQNGFLSAVDWSTFNNKVSSTSLSGGTGISYNPATGVIGNTGVLSFNGRTGAVTPGSSDYTTTQVAEGTNLYYTDARARAAFSNTAAGLNYNNTTGVLSYAAGYAIPTTASSSAYESFYQTPSTRITAGTNLTWSGNTLNGSSDSYIRGLFSASSPIAYNSTTGAFTFSTSTFTGSGSNLNADYLDGLDSTYFLANSFSTTSANAYLATKTTDNLTEGTTNLYYTNARARSAISVAGTPLTYNSTTGVLGITQANASTGGYLSATDFTTFNNKQATITAGTGLSFAGNTLNSVFTQSGNDIYNNTTGNVGFGTTSPSQKLSVQGNALLSGDLGVTNINAAGIASVAGFVTHDDTGTYAVTFGRYSSTYPYSYIKPSATSGGISITDSGPSINVLTTINRGAVLVNSGPTIVDDGVNALQVTGSGKFSTNLGVGGTATIGTLNGLIKGTAGVLSAATAGTDYENPLTFSTGLNRTGNTITNTGVLSFNGRTGAVVPGSSDYTTTQVAEGTNLYYTNARARGALSATAPLAYNSATGVLSLGTVGQANGGTGFTTYVAGDILYADNTGTLSKLPAGATGQVLKIQGGLPSWGVDQTVGGGGSDGIFATSSGKIYPLDTSQTLLIGTNATSTLNSVFEVNGQAYISSKLGIGTTSPSVPLSVTGAGLISGTLTVGNLIDTGVAANSLTYLNAAQQLSAVTINGPLTFTTGALGISQATGSTNGYLASADFNTFNGKQAAISGTIGQFPYFSATNTLTATSSLFLDTTGNVGIGTTTPMSPLSVQSTTGAQLTLAYNGTNYASLGVNSSGALTLTPNGNSVIINEGGTIAQFTPGIASFGNTFRNGGTNPGFNFTSVGTNLTSGLEATDVYFNLANGSGFQHGSNTAIALEREFRISAPTERFVNSGGVITDAASFSVDSGPNASTNAAITNSHAIYVPSSALTGVTNGFGLTINAPTGATNNYAAEFLGGNVGIGTTTPGQKLSVAGGLELTGGFYDANYTAGTNGQLLQTTGSGVQWVSTSTLGFAAAGSGVTSFNGRIGAVLPGSGDYTTTQVAEGTNLYYTDTRARGALSSTATGLTYTSSTGVFSLTAGYTIPLTASTTDWNTAYLNRITTANAPLSIANNTISISQASSTANGYLSSADYSTFAAKQAAITPGTGLSFAGSTLNSVFTQNGNNIYNNNTGNIGIGTTSPAFKLDVGGKINTAATGGYYLNGGLLGYASTTNQSTIFGLNAGGQNATTSASILGITAVGYEALSANTGGNNSALGGFALYSNTSGQFNSAVGAGSLEFNTTGSNNVAFGNGALTFSSASYNTAIGAGSMAASSALGNNNTGVGYNSLNKILSGSANLALGYQAGYNVTSGSQNILIGETDTVNGNNITTGSNNIGIGYNAVFPSATGSNQLNIANSIFGTITATSSSNAVPASFTGVKIGIATTTPTQTLSVAGGLELTGGLYDANYSAGTNGQLLQTTGSGIQWVSTTTLGFAAAGSGVTSFNGRTGAVLPGSGDYTTTQVAEGTNLYYTDTRARGALSSTATGLTYTSSTGVFSLTAGYTIPLTASTTDWNTAYVNRITTANAPLSITNNAINISQANGSTNGYLSSTDWNTFNGKISSTSLSATGPLAYNSSTGVFSLGTVPVANGGTGSTTLSGILLGNGTGAVQTLGLDSTLKLAAGTLSVATSTFTGSGSGLNADYLDGLDSTYFLANSFSTTSANAYLATKTTDNLTEGTTNLYFTNARARSAISVAGTPLTYNSTTGVLGINQSSSISDGYLSSTDWNTFNNKQNALTFGNLTSANSSLTVSGGTGAVIGSGVTLTISTSTFSGSGSNFNADYLDGLDSTYFLANSFSTTSANAYLATKTTDNLTEGTTNLYFTNTRARAALSSTATGLTYTSSTGVFSLTSGYTIPLTASTTDWNTAYTNRITTANAPLSITNNTISISQATGSTNGYLSSTDYATFNNKISSTSLSATGPLAYNSSTGVFSLGTVGVANGGTGSTTLTGILKGIGTGSILSAVAGTDYLAPGSLSAGTGISYNSGTGVIANTGVLSFNGRTGAVTPGSSDYTTTQVAEGTNLYYTNARARGAISVAGTPLAYNSTTGVLSINQASSISDGYLSSTDWNTFNNKQNALTFGNLTSGNSNLVVSGGTGSVIGSGVTITLATSTFSGSGSGLNADYLDGLDSTYFLANSFSTTSANAYLATKTTDNLAEGSTNLYFTNARARSAISVVGTPLTYNATTGVLGINQASSISDGYLSSTDWNTFNNKQNALTFGNLTVGSGLTVSGGTGAVIGSGAVVSLGTVPVANGGTGSTTLAGILKGNGTGAVQTAVAGTDYLAPIAGTTGQVPYFSATNTLTAAPGLFINSSGKVGIGNTNAFATLTVTGNIDATSGINSQTGPFNVANGSAVNPTYKFSSGDGFFSLNHGLGFSISSGEVARFSSTGNFGIGTTSPGQKLSVAGTGYFTGGIQFADGTTQTTAASNLVTSVFGRTGAIVATTGDYTSDQVTEGTTNLYYTDARARAAISVAGTPLTYNSTTGVLGINQASSISNGYLSSTDWNTFNNKQNALTFGNLTVGTGLTVSGGTGAVIGSGATVSLGTVPVANGGTGSTTLTGILKGNGTGSVLTAVAGTDYQAPISGSTGQFPYFSATNTLTATSTLFLASNGYIGIGTTSPNAPLTIGSAGSGTVSVYTGGSLALSNPTIRSSATGNLAINASANGSIYFNQDNSGNAGVYFNSLSGGFGTTYYGSNGSFNIGSASAGTNPFTVATGTVAVPAIAFGDVGTGLYRPAANQIGISISGSQLAYFGSTGVGIGTSTPTQKFSVAGGLELTGGLYDKNYTAGTNGQILQTTGTGIQWVSTSTLGFTNAVTSVFGRTGAIVATSGDYNTSQVTESGNLYYTDARARAAISVAGTPLTYNSTTGVLGINQSSSISDGYLTSTDWNTFNNKQNTLTAGSGISIISNTISNTGVLSIGGLTGAVATSSLGLAPAFTATYPIVYSGNNLSLAFGTTTANTWSQLQTFTSGFATNASSTIGGVLNVSGAINAGNNAITGGNITANSGLSATNGNITSGYDVIVDNAQGNSGSITTHALRFGGAAGEGIASKRTTGGNQYGLDFYTSSTNRLAITGAGRVGIGTTTPTQATFTVAGSGLFTGDVSLANLTATGTASVANLTIGTLNGPLQANNGVVSATSSIGVLYGGTGLTTAPTYGQILVGNSSGGYTLTATSSLGITSPVTSVFGRTGAIVATSGDYNSDQVTEGTTNLYFTNARARAAISVAGTPLTYNSTTGVLGINQSSSISDGYLTSTDWNTFNNKQNAITAGTGLSFTGNTLNSVFTQSGNNIYNNNTGNVGIGTSSPSAKLEVFSAGEALRIGNDTNANTYIGISNIIGTGPRALLGYNATTFGSDSGYASIQAGTAKGIGFTVNTSAFGGTPSVYITSVGSVGIGTTNPVSALTVQGGTTQLGAFINTVGGSSGGAGMQGLTSVIPAAVNDRLGFLTFGYINTGTNAAVNSAAIQALATQAWTVGSAQGTALTFATTPNGSTTRTEVGRFDQNGNFGIGTTSPVQKLSVVGGFELTGGLYDRNYTAGTNGQILQTTGTGIQWVSTSTLGFTNAVSSVFGRTGAIVATSGDYNSDQVTEGTTNLYFTNARAQAAISITGAPLTYSGGVLGINQASGSQAGYLSAADYTTFNNKQTAGNYITALTGDVTASGPGSAAATLATVNGNVGSFGGASSVPTFTVNAKGLITAAGSVAVVAPAGTLSGTTLNATIVNSSLTSVGTLGSLNVSGNATTTSLAISGTTSTLLKTNSLGQVIAAIAGTDYQAAGTYVTPSSLSATAPLAYNSGTGVFSISQANGSTNGYLSSADWNTFNNKISSSSLSGGTGIGYNGTTGVISNTGVTSNVAGSGISVSGATGAVTISNTGVLSFNGRTGAVVPGSSDYTTTQVAEGTNLYYTDTRARAALSVAGGALTYNSSTGVVTLNQASVAGNGYLSSTDYTTFNNKISSTSLSATGPLAYNSSTGVFSLGTVGVANGGTGSTTLTGLLKGNGTGSILTAVAGTDYQVPIAGTTGQFPYFSSTNTLTATSSLFLAANGYLGIGTTSPFAALSIQGPNSGAGATASPALAVYGGTPAYSFGSGKAGGAIILVGGAGGSADATGGIGGAVTIAAGAGGNPSIAPGGIGGALNLTGGAGGAGSIGGSVFINPGAASPSTGAVVLANLQGNVGIGTTSPSQILSVNGNGLFNGNISLANLTATGTVSAAGVTIGTLNGPLQANNGVVSATSSIGVLYGGTGLTTAPTYGQILVGNSSGGYTLTATSSLGFAGGVTSVFGRTGAVVATSGDYNTSQVTENTNLYYTDTRARAALSVAGGALTYNSSTGVVTLNQASVAGNGYLSSTDYTTFNNKISSTSLSATGPLAYNSSTGVFSLGTVGVANGGTGSTTLSGILIGNGTSAVQTLTIGTGLSLTGTTLTSTGTNYFTNSGAQTTLTTGSQLNVPANGGYYIGGNLLGYASSTNSDTIFGLNAGGTSATTSLLLAYNSAFGNKALSANSTGNSDNAFGYNTLSRNTSGSNNNAFGASALSFNTTGNQNSAFGDIALQRNTTGSYNSAFGVQALQANTTGSTSVAVGTYALYSNTTGYGNVGLGYAALYNTTTGVGDIGLGANVLSSNTTGSNNIALGNSTLTNLTKGGGNIQIGADDTTFANNLTTGSDNIAIGHNAVFPSATANYQLNIGNSIFGTLVATSTSTSVPTSFAGLAIGIGTSTPTQTLSVAGGLELTGGLYDKNYTAGTNGQILQTTGTGVQWVATSTLGFGSGAVSSVFGRTGAVVATSGDYNTDLVTEGATNLYYTDARARAAISVAGTPLTYNSTTGVLGINQANTSTDGYLSATDWNTFNGKQSALTFTYPLVNTANTISLAFGTTTANTWSQLQTFSAGFVSQASSTVAGNFTTSGSLTVSGTATSTILGGFTAGTNGALSVLGGAPANSLFIAANGNIGLGTSSPTASLSLYNTNTAGASPSITLGGNPAGDTDFWIGRQNNNDSANNDSLQFGLGLTPGTTPLATLTYNGNFGIGTTSPAQLLSVAGTGYFTGGVQFGDGTVQTTAATGGSNYFTNSGASTYLSTGTNLGIGTTTPTSLLSVQGTATPQLTLAYDNSHVATFGVTSAGNLNVSPTQNFTVNIGGSTFVTGAANTTVTNTFRNGSSVGFSFISQGANLTAGTEVNDVFFNIGNGVTQHASNGAIGTQREFRIGMPTETFASAGGVITNAMSFAVDGAPNAGTNAAITNSHGIYVGTSTLSSSVTNAYALTINAPSGATNNYAAQFLGGNVGIGTSSPSSLLSVAGTGYFTGGVRFGDGTVQTTAATAGGSNYFTNSGASTYLSTGTNLGIGTTTPVQPLSVVGTGYFTGGVQFGDGTVQTTAATGGGSNYFTNSGASTYLSTGTNLGVGTSTPSTAFSVVGTGYFTGGIRFADGSLQTSAGTATNYFSNSGAQTTLSTGTQLNVPSNGGYYQGGALFAYSSTTNYSAVLGIGAGASSVQSNPSPFLEMTAIGYNALNANTTGQANTAVGNSALLSIVDGSNNTGLGDSVLSTATTTSNNVAIGAYTLRANTKGSFNVAVGASAFSNSSAGFNNTALGYASMNGSLNTTANNNVGVGYQSGFNLTTGAQNILVGVTANTGGSNVTTGSNNIGVGYNAVFPSATGNNQLNIGNTIFGTLVATSSSTAVPTSFTGALIGIATTTPLQTLSVGGNLGVNSTSATALVVGANGATNPALQVDASTASSVTGLLIKSAASGGGIALSTISSNATESLSLNPKGTGALTLGTVSTGAVTLGNTTGTVTVTGATANLNTSAGATNLGNSGGLTGVNGSTLTLSKSGSAVLTFNGAATFSSANTNYSWAVGVNNTAATARYQFTGIAESALTASTEAPEAYFNFGQSRVHATGALALQRDFRITGSTNVFSSASTLTNAAAFSVDGPPAAGAFATIGTSTAVYLPKATLTSSVGRAIGLYVEAPTGATTNYAAIFNNGNVGIGTSSPASTLTVTGSGCFSVGAGATLNCGTAAGNIYYTNSNTGNYDVAENYVTNDAAITAGTIVAVDPNSASHITTAAQGSTVLGVISTAPGVTLGGADGSTKNSITKPVALSGRIPVKVSTEGGTIKIGDRIALSSTPGVGMKAIQSGQTVGIALENYNGVGNGTVEVFVQPQYYFAPADLALNSSTGSAATSDNASSSKLAVSGSISGTSFTVTGAASDFTSKFGSLSFGQNTASSVLSADGTGVNVYKMASFTLSGVQALTSQMATITAQVQGVASSTTALNSQLGGISARVSALEAAATAATSASSTDDTASSSLVATTTAAVMDALKGLGVLIQQGVTQFDTMVVRNLVFSKDTNGDSAAGSGTILGGNTVVQVENPSMTTTSKISITFTSPEQGSWYISDKQDGSFKVTLSQAQASDVTFDYFIVQTEGQIASSTPQTGGFAGWLHSMFGTHTPQAPAPVVPPTTPTEGDTGGQGSGDGSGSASSTNPGTTPTVTLNGNAAMALTQGDVFIDPGAVAHDSVGADISSTITVTGSVDTTTTGIYTLKYSVTDSTEQSATVSRVVTVSTGYSTGTGDSTSSSSGSGNGAAPVTPPTTPPATPSDAPGGSGSSGDTTPPAPVTPPAS